MIHVGTDFHKAQNDGWIEGQELLVMHDGAKTWKEVALPNPEKAEHDPAYLKGSLPIFPDKDHGFMVAQYRSTASFQAAKPNSK
jgi:hypothetical protein